MNKNKIKTWEDRLLNAAKSDPKNTAIITVGNYVAILDEISALRAAPAQQASPWMPIETAPKNTKIIVTYKNVLGKNRTVFATYIGKFSWEANSDTDCETDYNEINDTYHYAEGWCELIDNWDEFTFVYFDSRNVPTHWQPIPTPPEQAK
jgi:hypothetical protein